MGQQIESIEVPSMDEANEKNSVEVQKRTSESCFKTKMTFKNVLEYSRVIPA